MYIYIYILYVYYHYYYSMLIYSVSYYRTKFVIIVIEPMIRYVYSIDHVTCSTYVCICAAAILVLLATFELTE